MRAFFGLLAATVLLAFAGAGALAYGLWYYGQDLPDYEQLADYEPPVVSRVHAGDGSLLAEFAEQRRVFVPVESIPARVREAFLAAEDSSFYSHFGLSIPGILRATVNNIQAVLFGGSLQGGSTITQQVAKNFLLSPERTLRRKAEEAILALRIERAFTKDEILELYLNEIYLGRGAYGVASAALNYFDKPMDRLSIAEAAYLAALPKAPARYDPETNRNAAVARRNYVIDQMAENGFITQAEAATARAKPIEAPGRSRFDRADADYFVEEVRRELFDRYGRDQLFGGGLSVRTTLEPRLQTIAETALRDGLVRYDRRHGWRGAPASLDAFDGWAERLQGIEMPGLRADWRRAVVLALDADGATIGLADGRQARLPMAGMSWARPARGRGNYPGDPPESPSDVVAAGDVVPVAPMDDGTDPADADRWALRQMPEVSGGLIAMDPHTGRVLAMTGGFDFARSEFNRAVQAQRQPGSAFKPFVYLAALQERFAPNDLVMDAPITIERSDGQGAWRPGNYSGEFYGPSPLRVGIEQSRNLMTIRLANHIGMDAVAETAEGLGVYADMPRNLATALGAAETSLRDLTAGYAMIANGGRRITPTLIDRVQDRFGNTIFRHDDRACPDCQGVTWAQAHDGPPTIPDTRAQVVDPRRAYQVTSMLAGVIERGTGAAIGRRIDAPLAGKTGTTDSNRDAWFVGFSPNLAVGVYVGYDDASSLGPGETGGRVAGPIFADVMSAALEDRPSVPFRIPDGIRLARIDLETGQRATQGDTVIREAFLRGEVPAPEEQPLLLDQPGDVTQASAERAAEVPASDSAATPGSGTGGLY